MCGGTRQVRGQSSGAPAGETATSLRSEVRRDINRYRWIFGGETAVSTGRWSLFARSQYSSDALVLFDDRLSFRDELSVDAGASRPLGRSALSVTTSADWYSLSRVLNAYTRGGLRLDLGRHAWIEPQAGVALDRRPGISQSAGAGAVEQVTPLRSDAGPTLGLARRVASDNGALPTNSRFAGRRAPNRTATGLRVSRHFVCGRQS